MNYTLQTSDENEFRLHYYGPQLATLFREFAEWLKAETGKELNPEERGYLEKVKEKLRELRKELLEESLV